MKRLSLALLLCVVAAGFVRADERTADASQDAKPKRRKSTTKVITNDDVKKSKGVLIDTQAAPGAVPPAEPGLAEKHEAARRAQAELESKTETLRQLVVSLERQLAAVEQSYYDENDLHRRDTEIVKRFEDVKSRLDAARESLRALLPPVPGNP